MTQPATALATPQDAGVSSDPAPRLRGRWLVPGRGSWIVLVVVTLAIFFGSLPVYLAQRQTPCTGSACVYQQLTPEQVTSLQTLGLSLGDYAVITIALLIASVVVCLAVSALIIWRRPDDRMALLVALMLVVLGPIIGTSNLLMGSSPWLVPNELISFLAQNLLLLVFLLFPSGQFVPRWTRWTLVAYLILAAPISFFPDGVLLPNIQLGQTGWIVALGELVTIVLVQVYRYRRVSSPVERQQTKWVVFGVAVPITLNVLGSLLVLVPGINDRGSLYPLAYNEMGFLLTLFPPLSIGIAMLRSRLWEIDTIINKALVYGGLSAFLGALYAGLIIGLTSLAETIVGTKDQPVILVISTLAIAALFLPLRRRIQALIDRRFYRKKYDAEKTLVDFSATLRNETNLEQLRGHLLTIVQETMQPAHVSLWLRQPEPQHKRSDKAEGVPL